MPLALSLCTVPVLAYVVHGHMDAHRAVSGGISAKTIYDVASGLVVVIADDC